MTTKLETLKKIKRAAEIFDSMNARQIEIVNPYVAKIAEIQSKINEAASKVKADKICSECQGACCVDGIEYGISVTEYLYAMFYISLSQRAKVLEVIGNSNEDIFCSLITEKGCVLPEHARPISCKSFHCFMIPGHIDIMHEFGNDLRRADADYRFMLDMMEVEL